LTRAIEPYTSERRARKSTAVPAERAISILVQPDVALHQTKGGTARRHLVRGAVRVLTVAAGDVAAAALAAVVVRQAAGWLSSYLGVGQLPYSSAVEFCGALVMALLLTGSYRRSSPHPTLTLLIGCTLGVLMVSWSNFWGRPTLGAIPIALLLAVVTTGFLFLTRGALTALTAWLLPEHRRLVPAVAVSSGSADIQLDQGSGYRLAGQVILDRRHDESRAQELARMIRQVRAESVVLFGSLEPRQVARCLEISLNAGCEVLCTPPGYGVFEVRPSVIGRGPSSLIQVQPPTLKAPQVIAKRFVDVVGSCVAIACTAPLWMLVALAIRLDSPGPIFFSQDRVGLGGRRFRMLKFRTMRVGAHAEKDALQHLNTSGDPRVFKIPNDPRISRVGGFLRRWSLDELPQFANVIMGSMSLVGPRPVPEEDFVDYEDHHFRRLGAKPGITGLWQVNGRSAVSGFEERVRLDTEYIDRWSLWLDIKILLSTIPAVMRRTGAY
jgi:exopolysaccharide biosynthesis polyprenyl glycosylphosphotransferase